MRSRKPERKLKRMNATAQTPIQHASAAEEIAERRWRTVLERSPRPGDAFVYGVTTTGVFCRPGCASRRPLRENVVFYESVEAAHAAGLRACKRCRPEDGDAGVPHAAAIARACRSIGEAETLPSLDALAAEAGLSRFHFHRVFRALVGVTPRAYAVACRRARLQGELREAPTVTVAAYRAGYNSSSRMYARAEAELGMAPGEFRAGAAGRSIRFAVAPCTLGFVLVAATEAGICAIELGDGPEQLEANLASRFPHARRERGDAAFDATVAAVIARIESPRNAAWDVPLDVAGTAFQQRVWQALREIPAGATATYGEIAAKIGAPRGARAVAAACAANALAVAVPCHRAVRAGGALSGYRWGVERKRELLRREGGA
jgi:AraC family transcriptional regulator of adaptative response/methylated-DNA-[protein]-cysteine methyltransferase